MSDFERLQRIETKIDELATAMTQLVRIEERQIQQREDMRRLEQRVDDQRKELDNVEKTCRDLKTDINIWVNRGIGLWAAFVLVWTVLNSPTIRAILFNK